MMEKKKILVLLSAYNGEKYIEAQITSIMNQKTEALVMLRIRDDGSQDGTCAIIEGMMTQYPERIELIRGENRGYNYSFFALLNGATGFDYYAISDQDDVWMADKLRIALEHLQQHEAHIPLLYASASFLTGDELIPYGTTRQKKREFTIYNTIIQNICPGHTQVMNQALLNLVQGDWDTDRIYVYDSWIANIAMLFGKIVFDNQAHTYYRQHRANQLGYGNGKLGQLAASGKHADSGHGARYRTQIAYFTEVFAEELKKQGYYQEMERFLNTGTIMERGFYCLQSPLYRQSSVETLAFYAAVILGKF